MSPAFGCAHSDCPPSAALNLAGRALPVAAQAGLVMVGRETALHDFRKAVKDADTEPRRRGRRQARSPAIQPAHDEDAGTLGDHHDAVVACDTAPGIAVRAYLASENASSFGVLYAQSIATLWLLKNKHCSLSVGWMAPRTSPGRSALMPTPPLASASAA